MLQSAGVAALVVVATAAGAPTSSNGERAVQGQQLTGSTFRRPGTSAGNPFSIKNAVKIYKLEKKLKGYGDAIRYVETAMRAIQDGRPTPPNSLALKDAKLIVEDLDAIVANVTSLQASDLLAATGIGPVDPSLTSTDRPARRASIHAAAADRLDAASALADVKGTKKALVELDETAMRVDSAAYELSKAFASAAGNPAVNAFFGQWFAFAYLDMETTLRPRLSRVSSESKALVKALDAGLADRDVKVTNFGVNLRAIADAEAKSLASEQAQLNLDAQRLNDEAKKWRAEMQALEAEQPQLTTQIQKLKADFASANQESARLNQDINSFNSRALQSQSLASQINGMVYRDCPNGEPFDRCSHLDLKNRWVQRRNAMVDQFNSLNNQLRGESGSIEARRSSLSQTWVQLRQRDTDLGQRVQSWKDRLKSADAQRTRLVEDLQHHNKSFEDVRSCIDENAVDRRDLEATFDEGTSEEPTASAKKTLRLLPTSGSTFVKKEAALFKDPVQASTVKFATSATATTAPRSENEASAPYCTTCDYSMTLGGDRGTLDTRLPKALASKPPRKQSRM